MPDIKGVVIQSHSGPLEAEKLDKTIHRLASISVGIYWSAHKNCTDAKSFASFCLAVFCYHMAIPRQDLVEQMLVDAIHSESLTYYTDSGLSREVPGEQKYVVFNQADMPSW